METNEQIVNRLKAEMELEESVNDVLAKIKKISKKNESKDRHRYCFIIPKKIWEYISENKIPVYLRGFNLYWTNGFYDHIFFGKLHLIEGPDSKTILDKMEEKLLKEKKGIGGLIFQMRKRILQKNNMIEIIKEILKSGVDKDENK